MDIFYIKTEINKEITKQKLKTIQSKIGRLIVKQVAEIFYNELNTNITIENNKPKFENSNLNFNISHSNNIVAVAFDSMPLGLDIEYMKNRDFKSLLKRYNINSDSKNVFYQFWTEYEAEIKIQSKIEQKLCFELEENYMLSLFSSNPDTNIKNKLRIFELESKNKNIEENSSINLKILHNSHTDEKMLSMNEKNTSSIIFLTPLNLKSY